MQLLTYRVKEWNWLLWAWFCNKLVWSNHVLLIEASLLAAVMHYVMKCHIIMWFECKSCIISSQLYIHPIIFFKQNPWKKSEDTPANFTLGIYSIFKELLTLLLTNNPDTRLRAQCNLNTSPQCKTTYNRSTLQKTEQIPDGFLSFRKRERNVLWSTWTNNARLILITSV